MIQELYQKAKNTLQQLVLATTVLASAACAQVPLADQYGLSKDAVKKDISDEVVAIYGHQKSTQEFLGVIDKTEQPVTTLPEVMLFTYAGEPKRNTLGDVPSRTYSGTPPDDKPSPDPTVPYKAAGVAMLALAAITYFLHKGKEPEQLEFKLGLVPEEPIGPGAQPQDAPVYQPRIVSCKPKCK